MKVSRYIFYVTIVVLARQVFLGVRQVAANPLNAKSKTTAVFSIHPNNHRVFMYRGKPMKILTSAEHYGAVVNGDFDYDAYLKEMQRTGQNMTRVFAFYRETANGSPGDIRSMVEANTLAPKTSGAILPFQRVSGHGKALDGLGKFDLDR